MAVSVKPTDLIASWSENGTDATFPLASVPGLTAAEADATTGDWREILRTFCEAGYQLYYTTATADKPAGITVARTGPQADAAGVETTIYQLTFRTTANVAGATLISPA